MTWSWKLVANNFWVMWERAKSCWNIPAFDPRFYHCVQHLHVVSGIEPESLQEEVEWLHMAFVAYDLPRSSPMMENWDDYLYRVQSHLSVFLFTWTLSRIYLCVTGVGGSCHKHGVSFHFLSQIRSCHVNTLDTPERKNRNVKIWYIYSVTLCQVIFHFCWRHFLKTWHLICIYVYIK